MRFRKYDTRAQCCLQKHIPGKIQKMKEMLGKMYDSIVEGDKPK